jgi:hypothetical protein
LAVYAFLFDNVPTTIEKKQERKYKWELTPCKCNPSVSYSTPTIPLKGQNLIVQQNLRDLNRSYMKNVISLAVFLVIVQL